LGCWRGDISLKEAARKAHAAGLLYPKSGAKVPVSTVHTILRNRLYTGWFEWNGNRNPRVLLCPHFCGIWSGSFVEPWKYRACRRLGTAINQCSDGD
jgi:Recombinase